LVRDKVAIAQARMAHDLGEHSWEIAMLNEATGGCYHSNQKDEGPTCDACEAVFAIAYILGWGWLVWVLVS
jgi:5,10-methenyltetrahydromethanopterin hydrogenase